MGLTVGKEMSKLTTGFFVGSDVGCFVGLMVTGLGVSTMGLGVGCFDGLLV